MLFNSWTISNPNISLQEELSDSLGIHPVVAQVLINRDVTDVDAARNYLIPRLESLPDPFLLPDVSKGVERVISAIRNNEKIAVYGDYDVDGVTSIAILVYFFRKIGVELDIGIPHRVEDGYGLSAEAIKKFHKDGVTLLITVDNGTSSFQEVKTAKKLGIDTVITDHHEIVGEIPKAVAVINPKREDSKYPDRDLAGCGVIFTFLMALRKRMRDLNMFRAPEPNLRELLDLVAIGTIADIVALRGVNRTLVKFGLNEIKSSNKFGIKALLEHCALNDPLKPITTGQVAFRIAPRLNAAGRIGNAELAFQCLIADNEKDAFQLANSLERANSERKTIEERTYVEALRAYESMGAKEDSAAVVVSSTGWHPGVVGIVASRLARFKNIPAAVIACENGVGKGSVRSACQVDVLKALYLTSDILDKFGGHTQAAGFTIDAGRIDEFRTQFKKACTKLVSKNQSANLIVDAEVTPDRIDNQLVDGLVRLEPFGEGNAEPTLCASSLRIINKEIVGENHLRLLVGDENNKFSAIGFDMAKIIDDLDSNSMLAFVPQYNTWNGRTSIQLKIKAILSKNNAGR